MKVRKSNKLTIKLGTYFFKYSFLTIHLAAPKYIHVGGNEALKVEI